MPTLYLKISAENMPYLDALAEAAGSKSHAADLIITAARERGWSITPGTPRITGDPGRDMDTAAGASHSYAQEG
jgi:hypothetical protein